MLKHRIIPILTFNGFALVKTKAFKNPRMVGNPVQAARVYNSRGVDELVFLDIFASKQARKMNLKIVKDVIKECFMPVAIGGGIESVEEIRTLLQIGADKVVIKKKALLDIEFVKKASEFFGSQCISISVDVKREKGRLLLENDYGIDVEAQEFVQRVQEFGAGEIILNCVERDGMMNGFDHELFSSIKQISTIPIVLVGGGGNLRHFEELFRLTECEAVGASSIFHFTQFTPLDIKNQIKALGKPVRL